MAFDNESIFVNRLVGDNTKQGRFFDDESPSMEHQQGRKKCRILLIVAVKFNCTMGFINKKVIQLHVLSLNWYHITP